MSVFTFQFAFGEYIKVCASLGLLVCKISKFSKTPLTLDKSRTHCWMLIPFKLLLYCERTIYKCPVPLNTHKFRVISRKYVLVYEKKLNGLPWDGKYRMNWINQKVIQIKQTWYTVYSNMFSDVILSCDCCVINLFWWSIG